MSFMLATSKNRTTEARASAAMSSRGGSSVAEQQVVNLMDVGSPPSRLALYPAQQQGQRQRYCA